MTERIAYQTHWRWKIAFYLFLAGMGGGVYLTAVLIDLLWPEATFLAPKGIVLGTGLVILGIPFLIFDLGRRERFYRAGIDPRIAWIGKGFYILSAFIILGLFHIGFWIWPFKILEGDRSLRFALTVINGVFAFCVMAYTGLLLKSMKSIHFWDTPLIVILFTLSAFSTGITFFVLCSQYFIAQSRTGEPILVFLLKTDLVLILLEALVLVFYLSTMRQATEASEKSVHTLIRGDLKFLFWIGVILCGMILPFLFNCIELIVGGSLGLILTSSFFLLTGGLLLRYSILAAGVPVTPLLPNCQ